MRSLRTKTSVRKLHKEGSVHYRGNCQLVFLLQGWDDPYNVGGMFRVADACGATEIVMSGSTPIPPHPQISVTSLGHHRRVNFRYFKTHGDAVETLKKEGYHVVAVEIADEAVYYREYDYPEKTCLVLGNEGAGIHDKVLKACHGAVFIPMAGKGRSLNVHVAATVVAFQVLLGQPEIPTLTIE